MGWIGNFGSTVDNFKGMRIERGVDFEGLIMKIADPINRNLKKQVNNSCEFSQ